MKTRLLCCALSLLSGCASSGLYQMSDRWCGEHPGASTARCRPDPSKATTYRQYGEHPGDSVCGSLYTEAKGAQGVTCTPAQSWDQANLKSHDSGCPTAIFVAPGGELEQCQ